MKSGIADGVLGYMKINLKKIFSFVLVLTFSLSLTSCDKENTNVVKTLKYDESMVTRNIESGTIAENDNFIFVWDNKTCVLLLKEKETGKIYGTIPYDFYKTGATSGKEYAAMAAPIHIKYYEKGVNQIKEANGFTNVLQGGHFNSQTIKNGIKITYFFEKLEIAVPVYYELTDFGMNVYIKPAEIMENEKNKIYQVQIAPFMCAVPNSVTNYLFVPSGSGALMYTDVRDDKVRTYNEEVYGVDYSKQQYENLTNKEDIKLPVFGAVSQEFGIFGIISEGAESSEIYAEAGNGKAGYSNSFAAFNIRNYNVSKVAYSGNITSVDFWAFTDEITSVEKYQVSYYPIKDTSAGYSEMAKVCKNYLSEKYDIESGVTDDILNIDFVGGATIKKFFLGIPYFGFVATTDYEKVIDIIEELSSVTDSAYIRLLGYGQSGLDNEMLGGGFKLNSKVMTTSQAKDLIKLCDNIGFNVSVNFDLLKFNKPSNGFSTSGDVIRTINGYKAEHYVFNKALGNINENKNGYYILKIEQLSKALKKAEKSTEKYGFDSVAFSSLGSIKYSDYSDYKYYNSAYAEKSFLEATEIFNDKEIAVENANAYAAAMADRIICGPSESSQYDCLDVDVPFYQMVFKGIKKQSISSVNLSHDNHKQFLKSVEAGIGLSYTLTGEYTAELFDSEFGLFANSLYDDNSDLLKKQIKEYSELFNKISASEIKTHEVINKDLRKIVYENNTVVYVNYGENEKNVDGILIPAMSFSIGKGE